MKHVKSRYRCARGSVSDRYRGSVLTEYSITTGLVIAALFVPIPGVGISALDLLIQALNGFQNHSTVFISMP